MKTILAAVQKRLDKTEIELRRKEKLFEQYKQKLLPIFKTWGKVVQPAPGIVVYIFTPLEYNEENKEIVAKEFIKLACKQVGTNSFVYKDLVLLRLSDTHEYAYKRISVPGKIKISVSQWF